MKVELIDFEATDGVRLNGWITKNESSKIIIATHGMGSNCFKERERAIAEEATRNDIDCLVYNTRGAELARTVKKQVDGEITRMLAGTTYEDAYEGYHDIKGAIKKAVELGYQEIYLQGHSLGSTKTVYTYNRLKQENDELIKYIKGIILLSLVDIPRAVKVYLNERYQEFYDLAERKEQEGKLYDIMPKESFIQPLCVKSYLIYTKYCKDIDFARYHDENDNLDVLNNIDVPLFMRWGTVNEMIEQTSRELVNIVYNKLKNKDANIDYIDGADHSYTGKEEELARRIISFVEKH